MINNNLKIALFSFAALLILSIIYLVFAFIFKLPPFKNEDFGWMRRRECESNPHCSWFGGVCWCNT